MADLKAWAQAARHRLEKYQKDRGMTANDRPRTVGMRGVVREDRGAGRELAPMADQVPPV